MDIVRKGEEENKLSVIIPVFNCKTINRAIESIPESEQIEILVIDGKSDQATIEVINQYSDRINVFVSEKDKGLYDAMNKGVQMASGEWILTLAADDQLICNPLEILKERYDGSSDLICGGLIAKDFRDRYFIFSPNPNLEKLLQECSVWHPGTFFRKRVYQKYGLYNLQYRCGADREFFLRLYKRGAAFQIIPDLITYFTYGGISTKSPLIAYREDLKISDQYGISRFESRKHYIIRTMKYYGAKGKDFLNLPHKTLFMNKEQLSIYLKDHPEVIHKRFI